MKGNKYWLGKNIQLNIKKKCVNDLKAFHLIEQ